MTYKDAEARAYARGYSAGRKYAPLPFEPRPEPVFAEATPPVAEPVNVADLPLERRLQFIGVTVAAWTGLVKFHASGLVSSREKLADAMKMLEEALCEVEDAVADPFGVQSEKVEA